MNNPMNILLVEDDDVAAESVIRSLRKVSPQIDVEVAENGKAALELLGGLGEATKINKPFLVLLDLNMPVMNGFEFLEHIRNSENLSDIVVFVLTTSNDDRDKTAAYHHNVAGYMVKSAVGPQFSKLAHLLDSYQHAVSLRE